MDPRDQSPDRLLELASDSDSRAIRRLVAAVVGKGICEPSRLVSEALVPKKLVQRIGELPRLTLESSIISEKDRFQKLLFRAADGAPLETVLIPLHKPGAVSVCLSSQVGCVMGCTFCATARMSVRRNLRTWEIVDQFVQAREIARSQGRRVTGAVFMGMGEPFLNYERVLGAAELLCFPVDGAISSRAITISTVGLVSEIERFTDEKRRFRLSISLGAATDEKRAKLVPVAARTPVSRVMAAARRHALDRRDRINLAYVCVGGENTSEEDARALGELIGDTPVRLDLIDVTDTSGRYRPPTADELKSFRDALTRHVGQPVVRRYSGGADIRAACGTLAGQ